MNAKLEQLWGGYQFPFVTSQITFHKKVEPSQKGKADFHGEMCFSTEVTS